MNAKPTIILGGVLLGLGLCLCSVVSVVVSQVLSQNMGDIMATNRLFGFLAWLLFGQGCAGCLLPLIVGAGLVALWWVLRRYWR